MADFLPRRAPRRRAGPPHAKGTTPRGPARPELGEEGELADHLGPSPVTPPTGPAAADRGADRGPAPVDQRPGKATIIARVSAPSAFEQAALEARPVSLIPKRCGPVHRLSIPSGRVREMPWIERALGQEEQDDDGARVRRGWAAGPSPRPSSWCSPRGFSVRAPSDKAGVGVRVLLLM